MAVCADRLPAIPDTVRCVPGRHGDSVRVYRRTGSAVVLGVFPVSALANPVVLKLVMAIVLGVVALLALALGFRLLRKSMLQDTSSQMDKSSSKNSDFDITLATYQNVIQQFKAQGLELE